MSEERLSTCCGAVAYDPDSDICACCGEHAEFLTDAEYEENMETYEN